MRLLFLLGRLLILALILLVFYWLLKPRYDFKILVENDLVDIRGRIPDRLRVKLTQFLQEDVLLRGRVKITGRRRRDGSLALDFHGPVFAEDRQRIRNFLVTML